MALNVITIDFWNTIYNSENGKQRNKYRQRAIINELDKKGRLIKQKEFEDAMKKSWEFFNRIWFSEKRTPSPLETVSFFWDYLNIEKDDKSINIIIEEFAISTIKFPPTLNFNAKESIKTLSKDFDLAIVSDTGFTSGKLLRELLKKDDLFDYFSEFSFSDETGVSKPHPKAYKYVLEKLNCKPQNSLHIGDIERTDIEGAKNVGMYSIRYSGDTTGNMAKDNPKSTKADAELDNWDKVLDKIYEIHNG